MKLIKEIKKVYDLCLEVSETINPMNKIIEFKELFLKTEKINEIKKRKDTSEERFKFFISTSPYNLYVLII